jgi:putative oxygen-independent coproporphyrinogen III oxidase
LKATPPLSLYVHIPWCVRKCPYCDFNSHALPADASLQGLEARYIEALLDDLAAETELTGGREIETIFIGGGTPSLLSGSAITRLLEGIAARAHVAADAEISLEANPGAADAAFFAAYRQGGVTRLSIGAQSFDDHSLQKIGRIHCAAEAFDAFAMAATSDYHSINLDLMYGLPGQTSSAAMGDLQQAIDLGPQHISWYQLTIEPNTAFSSAPPAALPSHETLAETSEAGLLLLQQHGFAQYEVSAYARPDQQCRHNLNYWRFGDYIGIGAGAHGKLTLRDGAIVRRRKRRSPSAYLDTMRSGSALSSEQRLQDEDLVLEFMMNALRLNAGVSAATFEAHTGLSLQAIEPRLRHARRAGFIEADENTLRATVLGRTFLNNLLMMFS